MRAFMATKLSKRQQAMPKLTTELGAAELAKAVEVLKSFEKALPEGVKPFKFDQSIALTVRLGIDPKHADQIVRGSIVYPHGIGKSKRVLVFAQGPNVAIAQQAGAEFVGGKDL